MGKKQGNCVVYANCQRLLIERFLKASSGFNQHFKLDNSVPFNFDAIQQKYVIPDEIIKRTKLFIYQPIAEDKYADQSSDAILSRLPSDCACISFPHLQFNGYHPQYVHNPLDQPTEAFPFGKLPYGDTNVIKMIEQGSSKQAILQALNRVDFYSKDELLKTVDQTLNNLASREVHTDVRISDFIRQNYHSQRLFHTVNHPANIIGTLIVSQMLNQLNLLSWSDRTRLMILNQGSKWLDPVNNRTKIIRIFKEHFGYYQVPIYASVIENLGLTFANKFSQYRLPFAERKLTFNEYLEEYLSQYETVMLQ